jgi:hypothetical protein
MKFLKFPVFILLTLTACGQSTTSNKEINATKLTVRETKAIYQRITNDICNCTLNNMKGNKPSTSYDSCYKFVVNKYSDSLKAIGYDPASPIGRNMLANELKYILVCYDLYELMEKEWEAEDAKKLLFKGSLVSQAKLPSGLYEIIMKDNKTSELRNFFSKNPLDETQIKKYEPGYELTVEYEIIKNSKTNKEEFFLKESGKIMSVEAVKVSNQ